MKPNKENIFLDLSKLSEEQINKLRLEDSDFLEFSDVELFRLQNPEYMILSFNHGKFNISHKDWFLLNDKTELTYTQFLEMMGGETGTEIETFTLEDLISFGKQCFYSGFEKSEKDDANCFTAWREEASGLLTEFKSKQ